MRYGAGALWCALLVCDLCVCELLDDLSRARCNAVCKDSRDDTKCMPECVLMRSKPGKCPGSTQWFETACIESCSYDTDCPDVQKCCKHSCGITCQHPTGLDLELGLPSIPINLTISDLPRRQRGKVIEWSPSKSKPGDKVFYVLQVRQLAGVKIEEEKYESWRTRTRRCNKTKHVLTNLAPAHWYQVRVAAVNPNGSRGYSPPSPHFKLNIDPSKPQMPKNLTVARVGWVNGTVWAEVRWRRSLSDLPLRHYKLYWSRCLLEEAAEEGKPSNKPKPTCKQVMIQHKTLNYTRTNYILKGLLPMKLYFIQVQAITVPYHTKTLMSVKAPLFINTGNLTKATYNWLHRPKNSVKKLKVKSYYSTSARHLEALVTWESSPGSFLVTWSPRPPCSAAHNNSTYEAIVKEVPHRSQDVQHTVDHLVFNCKYELTVQVLNSNKLAKIHFVTPNCTQVSNNRHPC